MAITTRAKITGNITRLAISAAKREINLTCKEKGYPLTQVSPQAVEVVAITYLSDAIKEVMRKEPKL